MTKQDLLTMGIQYRNEGRLDMAIEMWAKAAQIDPTYGPAFINLFNGFKEAGNLHKAREALSKWMTCPLTPTTIDFVPQARKELGELNQRLNPQPPQPPQPPPPPPQEQK